VSTMETPPSDPNAAQQPPGPPERRCPRCGSTLSPDQEWCLSCGAAAGTEVVEARGWRVPLYLGGSLAALAVIGVILAIVALASRKDEVAKNPTPSPGASAQPPGAAPSPLPTLTPAPSASADPNATPSTDPNLTPTPTPEASPTAEPSPTIDPGTGTGSGGFTGADGDYTVIIESATSQSAADTVVTEAESKNLTDVGTLNSDDYSSLNGGYYVVYVGSYSSKSDAEDALDGIRSDFPDAYVRQIET
jgi:septal ring-binding cell division protein DamX